MAGDTHGPARGGRRPGRLPRHATVNALNLTSLFGYAVARLGGARPRLGENGLWLAEGYRLRFPVAGAFTIGNVVTTASTFDDLTSRCPDVLAHEQAHARQWALLGPAFLPLYLAATVWSLITTRTLALGNVFERQAGLVSGGYVACESDIPDAVPAWLRSRVRRWRAP